MMFICDLGDLSLQEFQDRVVRAYCDQVARGAGAPHALAAAITVYRSQYPHVSYAQAGRTVEGWLDEASAKQT